MTAAIAWNPGVVERPTRADKTRDFLLANVALLVPFGVFGLMFWLWSRHGRDPRRQPVAVQYEPPGALTPAEVGTLVDNSPDMRDITATVVDLAVRGFVRIKETQEDRFLGLGTKTDYALQLLRPDSEWKDAAAARRRAAAGAVRHDRRAGSRRRRLRAVIDEVTISDLKNRFYKHVPEIKARIFSQLIDRGYYLRRPDRVKATFYVLAVVAAIGGSVVSGILAIGLAAIVASILSGVIIGVFGHLMPARTVRGARALEGALGFEEFLDRVESDRFDRIVKTPAMFEKFLPFAMALGVERNWARAVRGHLYQPAGLVCRDVSRALRPADVRRLSRGPVEPRGVGDDLGAPQFGRVRHRRRRVLWRRVRGRWGRRLLMRTGRGLTAGVVVFVAAAAAATFLRGQPNRNRRPLQLRWAIPSRVGLVGARGPSRPLRRSRGHGARRLHGQVLAQRRERGVQRLPRSHQGPP